MTQHANEPPAGGFDVGRAIFFFLFFASGFTALLYQIVWQRILTFFSGADLNSVTIVVAAFMAGLGLGNLAGGSLADRLSSRSRLLALAACEFLVAMFALVSTHLYYNLLYVGLGETGLSATTMAVLLFVATLLPTACMGMSLPIAARILTLDAQRPARWLPALYGWNTVGAAMGALVTVTVLFRLASFPEILRWGALLNFACGVALIVAMPSLLRDRRPGKAPSTGGADATLPGRAGVTPWRTWLLASALSGFIGLSLELVWFRILGVAIKSSSFTFGWLLALYLTGIGVGALAAGSRWTRNWHPRTAFFLLQVAIPATAALSLTLFVVFVGSSGAAVLRDYFSTYEAGASFRLLDLVLYGAIPMWFIGPATIMMGASFAFLHRAVQTELALVGRRVGWLQAANTLGAVFGTIVTGLVLVDWVGVVGALRLLVTSSGLFLLAFLPTTPRGRRTPILLAVLAMSVAAATPSGSAVWAALHGTTSDALIFGEDRTGLTVLKPEGPQTVVFVNGVAQSRLPYGDVHTALGALPVLLHPRPRTVAIIGLGSGDTVYSAGGRTETESITCVEIVKPQFQALMELEKRRPNRALAMLLGDRRVRYAFTDGRTFLRRSHERYDVIEADALRPRGAYSGNLYSTEYFELLRDRLNPGGMAVTWIPTPRVLDTLLSVFPHVLVLGEIALAGAEPIDFDPSVLRMRLERPDIAKYYEGGGIDLRQIVEPLLSNPRIYGASFDRAPLTNLNRDLFPKDEFQVD